MLGGKKIGRGFFPSRHLHLLLLSVYLIHSAAWGTLGSDDSFAIDGTLWDIDSFIYFGALVRDDSLS